jgi:hypothetical protein
MKYLFLILIVLILSRSAICQVLDTSMGNHFLSVKCDTLFKSDTLKVSYAIYPDTNGFLKMFHPKQFIHNYRKVECESVTVDDDYLFSQYIVDGKIISPNTPLFYKESKSKYLLTNF